MVLKNTLLLAPMGPPVMAGWFLGKGLQSVGREVVFLYRSALRQSIWPVHTPFAIVEKEYEQIAECIKKAYMIHICDTMTFLFIRMTTLHFEHATNTQDASRLFIFSWWSHHHKSHRLAALAFW